jgi:MFS family permease
MVQAGMIAAGDAPERRDWAVAAWYGLFIIIAASVVATVNRILIALVAQSMKESLALSDGQLGMINGLALTLMTALAAFPIGWLADRIDRRWLLAACVLLWSAATVAFGLATSFPLLFLFAMGIAIGEGVLGPVTYSMIPDLFPREKWPLANFVFVTFTILGSYIGLGLGGVLLGYVTEHQATLPAFLQGLEPWRATIIVSTVFGPILAILILAMRVTRRQPMKADAGPVTGLATFFRDNWKTLAGVFLGFGLCYAAFGAQSSWSAVILQRTFEEDPATIGKITGLFGGIASVSGVGLAWLLVRWLRTRIGDRAPMLVAMIGMAIALLLSLALPFARTATAFYILIIAKTAFTYIGLALAPTILQYISPSHMRGRVVAVGGMFTLTLQSSMPWVIGMVSDGFFPGSGGILLALSTVIIPCLLLSLILLWWGLRHLPGTLAYIAERGED